MDEALLAEIAKSEAEKSASTPEEVQVTEPQAETPAAPVAKEDEQTIEEIMGKTTEPEVPAKKEETVPLSAHLELKKEFKELKKALQDKQDLKGNISSDDLSDIAEEFEVNQDFLEKFGEKIAAKAAKEAEEKYLPLLQKQDAEKRTRDIDEMFNTVYNKSLSENPQFAKIANKDVIKTLVLNPANAKKTVTQLIEEAYGNAVQGKPALERASSAPNKEDKIDFDNMTPEEAQKASTDPRYTAEYTEYLIKKGYI